MKKTIFGFLIFTAGFLGASEQFKPCVGKIISIEQKNATVEASCDVKKGSSGVVLHNFDKNHYTISASVKVIDYKDNKIKVEFFNFDALRQESFPVPIVEPALGDEVILNYLYDKTLLVAPDVETYNKITSKFKNITFIHPDLFAAKLAKDFDPIPSREDFSSFCKDMNFSLIFIALEDKGYFLDCHTFEKQKITYFDKTDKTNEVQIPFYTRIKEINKNFFDFGGASIGEYFSYYKKLIGE